MFNIIIRVCREGEGERVEPGEEQQGAARHPRPSTLTDTHQVYLLFLHW